MSTTTLTRLGPLHVRDDEVPDVDERHLIEPSIWFYSGCGFCGHEDHTKQTCPFRLR